MEVLLGRILKSLTEEIIRPCLHGGRVTLPEEQNIALLYMQTQQVRVAQGVGLA